MLGQESNSQCDSQEHVDQDGDHVAAQSFSLLQAKQELVKSVEDHNAWAKQELGKYASARTPPKIIMLGDSGCEYACKDIERFCAGSTVVNKGVTGSTAAQWIRGYCPSGCNFTEAFSPDYGSGYTHAWVSIGGNDYLDSGCMLKGADLTRRIQKFYDELRKYAPPGIKIVQWSYVTPSESLPIGSCSHGPDLMVPGASAVEEAAKANPDVTYVDVKHATGSTPTTFSPKATHADNMHLNSKGYCKVFSSPKMQEALQCGKPTCSPAECDSMAIAFHKKKRPECQPVFGPTCGGAEPKPKCVDDDEEAIAVAKKHGYIITGCADVDDASCADDLKRPVLESVCPKHCGYCA